MRAAVYLCILLTASATFIEATPLRKPETSAARTRPAHYQRHAARNISPGRSLIRRDDVGAEPHGWDVPAFSDLERGHSGNAQHAVLTSAFPEFGVFISHHLPREIPHDNLVFRRHIESKDPGWLWDSTYGWDAFVTNGGSFTFDQPFGQDFRLGGRYHQYQDKVYFCPVGKVSYQLDTTNWMSKIDGSLLISGFTIPGTHDSASFTPNVHFLQEMGGTQGSLIPDQLNNGIRFFDLRIGSAADPFKLRHGLVEVEGRIDQVFIWFKDFLANHPTETVLVSIKWDYDGVGAPADLEAQLANLFNDGNHGSWHLTADIPTLDQVRGKIVLLRRFGGTLGYPLDIADNTELHVSPDQSFRVQDLYRPATTPDGLPDYNHKWNVFSALLNNRQDFNGTQLNMNFLSAVNVEGPLQLYKPQKWANEMNARLQQWLDTVETVKVNLGIVPMDFPEFPGGDWDFEIKEMMEASTQSLVQIHGQVQLTKRLILTNFD